MGPLVASLFQQTFKEVDVRVVSFAHGFSFFSNINCSGIKFRVHLKNRPVFFPHLTFQIEGIVLLPGRPFGPTLAKRKNLGMIQNKLNVIRFVSRGKQELEKVDIETVSSKELNIKQVLVIVARFNVTDMDP